ncbi:Ca2+-binding RTX toxin-like protein [Sphingomonas naasensis]|uniref:calcium-binding protein n=1 Tax=Sphingomonas naasensis TaxID=1344951 RepID=UPI00141AEC71|nr:calcium-binding protein [Sphingomonas naasensis]NIJ19677.1 Ca2+-binding RTX toxin-like protein [Sphingomonas naasensis]
MANIIGTEAADALQGTTGDDVISALGDGDTISITAGHDSIDGGTGSDSLFLYSPNVALAGGPRSYTITGSRFFDGSGTIDTSFTAIESIYLTDTGTAGVTIDASASGLWLTLSLAAGIHNVTGGTSDDDFSIKGGWGSVDGGTGNDWLTLTVNAAVNGGTVTATQSGGATIWSRAGGESLTTRNIEMMLFAAIGGGLRVDASGAAGPVRFEQTGFADSFVGTASDDMVTTGTSAAGAGDVLTGGGGADTYYFKSFAGFRGATITDFAEQDEISLLAVPATPYFIGTAAFSGRAGEIRFVRGASETLLIGDADGDGIGESTLTLSGSFQLAETGVGSGVLRRVPDQIIGTEGDDVIVGTTADETVHLLSGYDQIYLSRGHDVLDGGAGGTGNYGDLMQLHSGLVALPAGPHHYTLTADRLSDATGLIDTSFTEFERISVTETSGENLTFDAGATELYVWMYLTTGAHQVTTGSGNDQITLIGGSGSFDGGSGAFDSLFVQLDNAANGATIYISDEGGTTTLAQAGRASVTERNFESFQIATSAGALRVDASAAARAINFSGTALADTIIGSTGANQIDSDPYGLGAGDIFTGGGGNDWFTFWTFAGLHGATITDFDRDDLIDLHLITGARFIGTTAFHGVAGEIRYEASGGQTRLIGDADGDGVGDSVLTLSNRQMTLRETYVGSQNLVMGPEQITGTEAGETLFGTTFADEVRALGGSDTIKVSRGIDSVDGGTGTDMLELDAALLDLGTGPHVYTAFDGRLFDASSAFDTSFTAIERLRVIDTTGSNVSLSAGGLTATPLTVTVQAGTHELIGGWGNDGFVVGGGSGTVDGRAGTDTLAFTTDQAVNSNPLVVTPTDGAMLLAQAGGPSLTVRNIETIQLGARIGSGLNVAGSASNVRLVFALTAMADVAVGGAAGDLFSVAGAATGMGDVLTGGGGADTFAFSGLAGFSGATITDLQSQDTIQLTSLPPNTVFIGGADFSGAGNAEYRYLSGSGLTALLGDADGDGEADSAMLISNGAFVLAETSFGSGVLRIVGQLPANDAGPNTMIGTEGIDYLDSGAGNDVIEGRGGDDVINAGEGNDRVLGGAGMDSIHGGDGNDILDGGADGDYVFGDDGDDTITAAGGGDRLSGGYGNDILTARDGVFSLTGDVGGSTEWDGDDRLTLTGGSSGSSIDAGGGNDVIDAAGTGTINVFGGSGDDDVTIRGFTGGMVLLGQGDDRLSIVGGGGFQIDLGGPIEPGRDKLVIQSLTGSLLVRNMNGGEQGDVLDLSAFGANPFGTGTLVLRQQGSMAVIQHATLGWQIQLENVLAANLSSFNLGAPNPAYAPQGLTLKDSFWDQPTVPWDAQLSGADGNDTIGGYGGNDILYGGGGADQLDGGQGDDKLDGGSGDDVLVDGAGQDWLIGGNGADRATGGDGHDTLWGGDGGDLLNGGAGDDTIVGGAGIDTVSYADASAAVEINLSILEDQLTRGAGVDTLVSIENIIGSGYGDVLAGDAGANRLTGGGGGDRFVFEGPGARDTITDFDRGDLIDLGAIDANGALAGEGAFAFIGAAAFGGIAGQLRVSGGGTGWIVEADTNGDRVADFSIAVTTLSTGLVFAGSDFLL